LYKIERVSSVLLIGGASITKQQQAIRKNISIVVGTPENKITNHFVYFSNVVCFWIFHTSTID